MKRLVCMCYIFILHLYGCSSNSQSDNDIELFKGTPIWDLARAVDKEDVSEIKVLIKKMDISVNYQEPLYGETLLEWAVRNNKYNSTEALIKAGANSNIRNNYDGHNALIEAADKVETSKFLKLLLSNGANPNDTIFPKSVEKFPLTTPLITAASKKNLENVKLLVDAGADINYRTPKGNSALRQAALMNHVFIVRYLLIEKKAEFNYVFMNTIGGKKIYLVDYMRNWPFELGSKKWESKMEIARYLKENGMDYFKTPIPKDMIESYPKEYLEKY